MAQCLVTTLSEAVDNPNIVAPDELVITVNHTNDGNPAAARRIQFLFRAPATVRVSDSSYHIANANGDDLGTSVSFNVNIAQELYFPNPDAGTTYKIIVSNKYALSGLNTQEYPTTQYDFFEYDFGDLKHCTFLTELRCMCQKITGDLEDLKRISTLQYLQIGRTGVTGDLASLKNLPNLRYFKGNPCDVYGDIAVIKNLPLLRNFEVSACLEIYGDIAAFANHTSINYITLPQVASHTAVYGDIANLAGCTSLGCLNASNEWGIYGDIDAFSNLDSLWCINLNGTSVYGNIGSLAGKVRLQTINLGNSVSETFIGPADNKISGDIASLAGLPMLYTISLQNTGVTGDWGDVVNVPRLSSIYATNTAVEGEMADFSPAKMPNLVNLDLGNCAGIAGDVADLAGHANLANLQIYGTNVTGDIGEALEENTALTSISFTSTNVSGDVTKVYKNTAIQIGTVTGCPNLEGDLSQLPPDFYYFASGGRSGSTFSWSANDARPASSTIVCFDNVDFGEDLEKMLINQANCVAKGNSSSWLHKRMNVWSSNISATTMSAACRTACETLRDKGFQILINNVLVVNPAA